MKFLDFLLNAYYFYSQDNFGLQSYKGGKNAYEKILQNQTFKDVQLKKFIN